VRFFMKFTGTGLSLPFLMGNHKDCPYRMFF